MKYNYDLTENEKHTLVCFVSFIFDTFNDAMSMICTGEWEENKEKYIEEIKNTLIKDGEVLNNILEKTGHNHESEK